MNGSTWRPRDGSHSRISELPDAVGRRPTADRVSAFPIGAATERILGDAIEVSAELDGQRLWYRFPAHFHRQLRGDAFLAAGLLPAMRVNRPIHVDSTLPVSPDLLTRLDRLQDIFRLWFPWATRIPIVVDRESPAPDGSAVAALFSGGVDSSYTLAQGRTTIDHLLFVDRVDTGKQPDRATYDHVLPSMRRRADAFGATLVECSTNAKEFGHRYEIDWHDMMGGTFSGLAMLLGLRELRFPSSATWADLVPSGTHPVTDPIWGTEALTVVHHGANRKRIEKLATVLREPMLREHLRVCMQGGLENCGSCEKCLRTMAGLRAAGGGTPTLPPLNDLRVLGGVAIRTEAILLDWIEIHDAAIGHDPELATALARVIRNHRIRTALRSVRNALRIRPRSLNPLGS